MAKTLFNSSEKSNFILNMTEEKFSGMAAVGLTTACFMVSLFTVLPECFDNITYSIVSGGLAVSGVICLIIALIAIIKKYIDRKVMLPVCAFGAMVLWGVISLLNSYDMNISLYGFPGRGEGLLAILFYFGFFVTAASLKREKAVKTLINGIIASGVLNALWSLIQIFTGELGHYKFVSITTQANAASGLAQSPLFLAMLLSISLTAAIIGAVMSENKKLRIIYIASACLFSFVMMFTYSLIGICGAVFAIIAAAVTVFRTKVPKLRIASVFAVIAPAAAAILIVQAGLIGDGSAYRLHDGSILWFADSYYRLSSSGDFNEDAVDITSTSDVYYTLNRKTMNIIEKMPLTGTGPDQLVYPQLYTLGPQGNQNENADISDIIINNKGTFDKCYNEYLNTAATRGIPSLIALLAVILPVLFVSGKNMNSKRTLTSVSLFFVALCGALLFLIGCSNITFSPVFWAAAGASCASLKNEKASKKEKASGVSN